MTHITIYKNSQNSDIVGFKAEGHSDYAYSGHDVICASVSALVFHTINGIQEFTDTECDVTCDEKNTIIKLFIPSLKQSSESLVLLKAFELSMNEIAKENKDYLSITFEEV